MRKDDYEGTGFCGFLIPLVVLVFIVSFCSGPKDKPALDNLIETTHNWINHVDSVWEGGEQ